MFPSEHFPSTYPMKIPAENELTSRPMQSVKACLRDFSNVFKDNIVDGGGKRSWGKSSSSIGGRNGSNFVEQSVILFLRNLLASLIKNYLQKTSKLTRKII